MELLLIILLLIIIFGGGFGAYNGHPWGGPGIGLGGVLLIILIIWLLIGH